MKKFWALIAIILLLNSTALAVGPDCTQIPNLACATTGAQTINATWTIATGVPIITSNFGANFTASDTNPSCGAGEYKIYSDLSETKLKKCQNGTVSDLAPAGGGVAWDAITNPTANQALTMSTFTTTWTWGNATGAGTDMFVVKDTTSNSGTGYVFHPQTTASSAAKPFAVTAGGTSNGAEMSTSGVLQKIGTGSVLADNVTCTTCIDTTDIANNAVDGSKINLTSNATGDLMIYNGTDWVRLAVGSGTQVLHGGTNPTWANIAAADIGAGDLANVLVWNETAGGTWPNKTLANAPRSVDTALVYNNGLIYTRHADCTGSDINEYMLSGTTMTMCDSTDHGVVKVLYEM